jgi:hypothetical protein
MYDTVLHVQQMSTGNNCLCDTLLNRQGWYIRQGEKMDSRPRQKHSGMTFLRAESTPQKHPSHWKEMLGGLEEHLPSWTKGCEEQKGSGGNDETNREGRINYLVVLADAGTHSMMQGWIPACAGMTDEKQGLDSRLRRKHPSEAPLRTPLALKRNAQGY